ncbi:MAG: hypothetical protein V4712_17575 [Pseudomonadota bacterium]
MTLPILPIGRHMTDDEKRGFRMACACFATWGRQLQHSPSVVPVAGDDLTPTMRRAGELMQIGAQALDRTLGRHG